jgi:hypothetical protein
MRLIFCVFYTELKLTGKAVGFVLFKTNDTFNKMFSGLQLCQVVYLPFKHLTQLLAQEYFIEFSHDGSFKSNYTLFKEQSCNCTRLFSGASMMLVLTDCRAYPAGPHTCTVGICTVHGVTPDYVFHSLTWAVLC